MAISATILATLFGLFTAFLAAVYCFKPEMIVRQANDTARRRPMLLHFALPIRPREGHITVRQVRSTGLGLFMLSAWFFCSSRSHLSLDITDVAHKPSNPPLSAPLHHIFRRGADWSQ
jgi:hypothetical protein